MQRAKITVSSKIRQDGDTSCMEEISFGAYAERDGWHYIRYEETAASEMAGSTVTLKWQAGRVVLLRQGSYGLRQEFEQDGRCVSEYRTPYLTLLLETHTRDVKIRQMGQGWKLELDYELRYGAGEVSRVRLRIIVEPGVSEK